MKQYDLSVQGITEFEGGGHYMEYQSKGHHDAEAFRFGLETNWERTIFDTSKVRHEWRRCVPSGLERQWLLIEAKPHSRGAYPVTVVDFYDTKRMDSANV